MRYKLPAYALIILFFYSCTLSRRPAAQTSLPSLKFLDEYIIPFQFPFGNTTVGGLSGIDYDSQTDQYFLISDDRSERQPARFYTARIILKDKLFDTIFFTSVNFLKNSMGKFYPDSRQNPSQTPDPEAMRLNAKTHKLVWSSEGEKIIAGTKTILSHPALTETDLQGNFLDTLPVPINLYMQESEKGPRRNGAFEGLAFSGDYSKMYVSLEEPLYEDGPRAGLKDSSGIVRIIEYDMKTKESSAQYAYKIDPVAFAPVAGGFKVNGISDIMWLKEKELLVIERSFSSGRLSNTIRVYKTDLSSADDVQHITSLNRDAPISFATKKLLINMDDLKRHIDNIEGVTFGPLLDNGSRSLIFVSDDNFNPLQKTHFLLFEIL